MNDDLRRGGKDNFPKKKDVSNYSFWKKGGLHDKFKDNTLINFS